MHERLEHRKKRNFQMRGISRNAGFDHFICTSILVSTYFNYSNKSFYKYWHFDHFDRMLEKKTNTHIIKNQAHTHRKCVCV